MRRCNVSFTEPAPRLFDFKGTARAHGWVQLRPFAWHAPTGELSRMHRLTSGKVVRLRLSGGGTADEPLVCIDVDAVHTLTPRENTEIRRIVRRMLRLDEDLGEFYALCEAMQDWCLNVRTGGGRLLRCPTLFEDVVYTLCTTNTTWTGTKRMVERLVDMLGEEFPGQKSWRAFPTAMAIATAGESVLRHEVRLGYRGHYLWQLAVALAEGRLDLASLEAPDVPIQEIHQTLLRIKGIGSYAAATLLMLLGRYEELAIDSQMRAFVARKYFQGQPITLAQIRQTYAPWGRWQYLAYWFDP